MSNPMTISINKVEKKIEVEIFFKKYSLVSFEAVLSRNALLFFLYKFHFVVQIWTWIYDANHAQFQTKNVTLKSKVL